MKDIDLIRELMDERLLRNEEKEESYEEEKEEIYQEVFGDVDSKEEADES